MIILEVIIAILLIVVGALFLLGLFLGLCIIIAKIKNMIDDKKYAHLREKFPDYYKKLDFYNEKFAAMSRFQLENIDQKKLEIDNLLNEIKYLPDVHVTTQREKIERLKQEIYDNTWTYKKMAAECELLNTELIKIRTENSIDV